MAKYYFTAKGRSTICMQGCLRHRRAPAARLVGISWAWNTPSSPLMQVWGQVRRTIAVCVQRGLKLPLCMQAEKPSETSIGAAESAPCGGNALARRAGK